MHPWLRYVATAAALQMGACKTPDSGDAAGVMAHDGSGSRPDRVSAGGVPALRTSDFPGPLTRSFIRTTNAALSNPAFADKWDESHKNAAKFVRSFPPAFQADMATVPASRFPGQEGLCFGDAHFGNFGFLQLDGQTVFGYNDLDDPGYCRFVALDAARYFTVVLLTWEDKELLADLVETYVDVIKDPSRAVGIADEFTPDWRKRAAKELERETSDDRLTAANGRTAASSDEAAAVRAAFSQLPPLAALRVMDVAAVQRDSGGSSGLRRYLVLVQEPAGTRRVLELKEAVAPGTDYSKPQKIMSFDERIPVLKRAFWGVEAPSRYIYVKLGPSYFIVREPAASDKIDVEKLKKEMRLPVMQAQVSYMARIHAPALQGIKKDDLRLWLSGTSETLANRWDAMFDAP